MKAVGEIIAKDVTMSAKMLQLANSSFFGLRRRVDNVSQAFTFLGLDTIKALVLTVEVFARFPDRLVVEFGIDKLYDHRTMVGSLALRIMKDHQTPPFEAAQVQKLVVLMVGGMATVDVQIESEALAP